LQQRITDDQQSNGRSTLGCASKSERLLEALAASKRNRFVQLLINFGTARKIFGG
jgi:hypothetical protein